MSVSNWGDVLKGIEFVLATKSVPVLIGEAGIGKTEIVNWIAERYKWPFVSINVTNLKEGELSMPYIDPVDKRVHYAPHYLLQKLYDEAQNAPYALLLLDEFNRGDTAVITECMQLVQQRRINDLQLPDNIKIIICGNPTSEMPGFEHTTYATTTLDDAMIDRGVFFFVKADFPVWLTWATSINPKTNRSNVHPRIIEFLNASQDLLHLPGIESFNKPTPRSWTQVSDILYANAKKMKEDGLAAEKALRLAANGLVGTDASSKLIAYMREKQAPLITMQEIFEQDAGLKKDIADKWKKETFQRRAIMLNQCISYMNTNSKMADNQKNFPIFIKLLALTNADLRFSIFTNLNDNHKELFKKLSDNSQPWADEWHTCYYETYGRVGQRDGSLPKHLLGS
jgi:MoxR-like ATPase